VYVKQYDDCVYVILLLYVDDILIFGSNIDIIMMSKTSVL